MRDVRKGNDIKVRWSLVVKGTSDPFNLSGLPLKLYLKNMYGRKEVEGFSVDGNTILWTFFGKDQKQTGEYSLELVANEGVEGMMTTDICGLVNLVSCSCKVGDSTDGCGVETETIEVQSEVEFIGGGSMTVDTELSETSLNPLANATVTAELGKKAEKLSDLDDVILIAPLNDAEVLIGAFKQYGLASKVNVSLLCVVKKERSDKDYQLATLVVEDYRAISAGWRLTFTFNGAKADAESSGKIDEGRVYSPNAWLQDVVLSYLYNEDLGDVIPLGSGNIKVEVEQNVTGAVLYTEQSLTEEQKSQARTNIGVDDAIESAIAELPEPESSVFEAIYGETTYEEIVAASNAGKVAICKHGSDIATLTQVSPTRAHFNALVAEQHIRMTCMSNNSWSYVLKDASHELSVLDNGNVQVTIAGESAEVATPSYVSNAIASAITNVLNEEV